MGSVNIAFLIGVASASPCQGDAIAEGLRWLARHQREDGSWGSGRDDVTCTLWAIQALQSAEISGIGGRGEKMKLVQGWLRKQAEIAGLGFAS